jgi:hypothetical protein
MRSFSRTFLAISLFASPLVAEEPALSPLFNGRDLAGWVPMGIGPDTFSVKDGVLVTTGAPIGTIRTEKMYENFVLELEWRHMTKGGNSGLFIWGDGLPATGSAYPRGIEVQILDTGFNADGKNEWYSVHGDVFPVNDAKMTPEGRISPSKVRSFPMEERSKPSPEWNHYRVVANNGAIELYVNGKKTTVASGASPRKGYIMLESEGAECQFRNVRIAELPSTNPKPEDVARSAEGFVPLFNGLNLDGWKLPDGDNGHWKVKGEVIDYDAMSEAKGEKHLWTAKSYSDYTIVVDWRIKETPYINPRSRNVLPDGSDEKGPDGKVLGIPRPDSDSGIILGGDQRYQVNIWCWPVGSGEMYGIRTDAKSSPELKAAVTPKVAADKKVGEWNRYEITQKKGLVTVLLNGKTVIPGAKIPGFPASGPIGLQHHGGKNGQGVWNSPPSLVQFRNLFIKELKGE